MKTTPPQSMGKRRRERDRPKAAHDALYNPNKRVMLSYASDEEVENEVADTQPPIAYPAVQEVTAAVKEPAESGESGSDSDSSSHSSTHRELFEEAWEEDGSVEAEIQDRVVNDESLWARRTTKNSATGQWAALGSLSYQWDEDENDYGEDDYDSAEEEAMSYLRAVRSERQNMPSVLKVSNTHSHEEIYENGDGDTRGYYEDGTYVAAANSGSDLPTAESLEMEPQEAFTRLLTNRFLKQRMQMHVSPGATALHELDDKHPISFPAKNGKAQEEWHKLIRTTVPLPAQVRSMQQVEVFRLIELIRKFYLTRETDITNSVSAWIWSLLARLDDVGTMHNDQVWILRELGRKAVLVQLSFSDAAAAKQLELVATQKSTEVKTPSVRAPPEESSKENLYTEKVTTPNSTDAAPTRASKSGEISAARHNTLATLDMVIVVVGEVFGQRDLLDFRRLWNDQTTRSHGD